MAQNHPRPIKVLIFSMLPLPSSCSLPTIRESTNVELKLTTKSPTSESLDTPDTQNISNLSLGFGLM
jgi:hypothetical protein